MGPIEGASLLRMLSSGQSSYRHAERQSLCDNERPVVLAHVQQAYYNQMPAIGHFCK